MQHERTGRGAAAAARSGNVLAAHAPPGEPARLCGRRATRRIQTCFHLPNTAFCRQCGCRQCSYDSWVNADRPPPSPPSPPPPPPPPPPPLCAASPAPAVSYVGVGGYKPKGVGGGGELSGFSMSPYNDLWFVGTDMGECWQPAGWVWDRGSHRAHPCTAQPVSLGQPARHPCPNLQCATGSLYRSTNAGASWEPVPHSQVKMTSDMVGGCWHGGGRWWVLAMTAGTGGGEGRLIGGGDSWPAHTRWRTPHPRCSPAMPRPFPPPRPVFAPPVGSSSDGHDPTRPLPCPFILSTLNSPSLAQPFAPPVGFSSDGQTLFFVPCWDPSRGMPCVAKRSTDSG